MPDTILPMFEVHTIPAFNDNYIWLIGQTDSPFVAVIDPGDPEPVIEALRLHGKQLNAILITHHHSDHIGGIRTLLERSPVPVYGPAGEDIPALSHPLREGDTVTLEHHGLELHVIDTPGHTSGHICYLLENSLFCGDTLFAGGCGRLFEGSPEQMHHSLSKISALPADTQIYCAHEYTEDNLKFARIVEPNNPDILARQQQVQSQRQQDLATVPSTLSVELKTNPFLRSSQAVVREAAERFAGHPLNSEVAVFATVRHWKDTLD